jgi:acetylornithine deacetylase/succinyl-diaminopimelate desuccinylase-like protein
MVVGGGASGGGSNFNVVPAATYFTVDGRLNPEADVEAELARISSLISESGPCRPRRRDKAIIRPRMNTNPLPPWS